MSKRKPDPAKLARQRLAERINSLVAQLARDAETTEQLAHCLAECTEAALEPVVPFDAMLDLPRETILFAALRADELPLHAPERLRPLWRLTALLRDLHADLGDERYAAAAEDLRDQAPDAWAAAHDEPIDTADGDGELDP